MQKLVSYFALSIVFIWFMLGGVTHFTSPDFFVAIMPPYLPWHLEIVYVSGGLEILFAGLLVPLRTRQLAGNLLILLTVLVTPANIHMWMNPDLFPDVGPLFLSLRLVLQIILLIVIWWSTRAERWRS